MIPEVVLIVWSFKKKDKEKTVDKSGTTNLSSNHDSLDIGAINDNSKFPRESQSAQEAPVLTEQDVSFENLIMEDGKVLRIKYTYRENLCFCENFDCAKLLDVVSFVRNTDNSYDPNTIEAICNEKRIGLLHKGDCRDIIQKSLISDRYYIMAFVCKRDCEKKEFAIRVAFYEELSKANSIITTLTKTGKIDGRTEEKRQERVEYMTEGDIVFLVEDLINECIIVQSAEGYELGEISASVAEKIVDRTNDDVESADAIVYESYLDDNYKTKIKILIAFD